MKKALVFLFQIFFVGGISAQCYQVAPTVFVHDSLPFPIIPSFQDDQYSGVIQIGFPFCFYGQTHSSLLIGSNGVICFDTTQANNYCPWPIGAAIPATNAIPQNSILFPFQDLYINGGGTISYATIGSSPNREFILELDSIAMYACLTTRFTGQVKLYETTNAIEIHIAQKSICAWNGGYAIEGIQNSTGTSAVVVPGRNYPTTWAATNEAWAFTAICNVCSNVGMAESQISELSLFVSAHNQISVFPNGNSYKIIGINDLLGQQVDFSQFGNSVLFAEITPGIYIVTLDVNGVRVTRKLMLN